MRWLVVIRFVLAAALVAGFLPLATPPAHAQLRVIDQLDEREDVGYWSRRNQRRLDAVVITTVVGLAVLDGTESRLGSTAWRAVDAALMTAVTTEAVKRVFGRPRPIDNDDPTTWFRGAGHRSFPSGEVAMMAAFATPFIMTYREEYPAVWALALLPTYMARARMMSQAHWPTDVLAGAAVGVAYGMYATGRGTPLVLSVTGRSVFIGLRHRF